ncbi:hypothetical protein PHSY_001896 [Pseudozyma hubeiensis SY62]|uniref:Uncharacterized protein n=1 Tax=Pseudozyma hubeiensis (strain SY62) TaxID=1305764 RepID=R9P8E5_PSEHS|nr:hypothetical protein PHSY_001896 [Pseudozyma hubeiensis SY62]GAC94325.1 hypothetical protein PHSY_001896 [Pseudozyma hubeiensis SY62]
MSRASIAESHAMDAVMSRTASRAGSISTLWSSAEVPFCLDPRTQPSFDTFDMRSYRGHSIAGSISRYSTSSSKASVDFARLSIDIPDEYPHRPDTTRLTPPRASTSTSSTGSSPSSRMPSLNIGTIDENSPMQPFSPHTPLDYQPPALGAQHRVLSSRFSEDTIDEPLVTHSASQGTFGARLSVPRKASGLSEASGNHSSRSSSVQGTDPFMAARTQAASAQAPTDLYRRAYRFFDKEYSVQASLDSDVSKSSPGTHKRAPAEGRPIERPSYVGSDLSHEGSLPSCSRSQTSTQASTSDAASAWSQDDTSARRHPWAPVVVTTESSAFEAELGDSTVIARDVGDASLNKSDSLSIPCLPSLPSFNSALTATAADYTKEIRRRPSTADVYSQAPHHSPNANYKMPLSPDQPMLSPTDSVRYQVHSHVPSPALSPLSKPVYADISAEVSSTSANSRTLRGRVASTPKLRLESSSLFSSQKALHLQHPLPPLPTRTSNPATDRRPSTSQTDGRESFFGRRFRSRTLGEADHADAANMKAAAANTAPRAAPFLVSPQRPLVLSSLSSAGASSLVSQRHPSHISAASSEAHSSLYPMQQTPGSSICSASSPATTLSSLPVTPRTTSTFPRPKSRGNSSASKSGGSSWASYLNSGLTLHIEGDHGRACQIDMTYLAYDPFGRPEQLVEDTDDARAITPKRPKSRGDKDQEAEQSGTLEFGPSHEMRVDGFTFAVGRKSDSSALLKHLTVGEDTKADLLTRQAALSLSTLGDHQVSGYERKGRLAWKFAYRVEVDHANVERRRLVPVRFSCSATLLNPERARKSRLLNLVKKQMGPTLASKTVASSLTPTDSPRSGVFASDDGTASPSSASARQLQHRQQPQQQQQQQQPSSPVRSANGAQSKAVSGAYNSPLRQISRAPASANNSIASADSSFYSQSTTPGRDASGVNTSMTRMHHQTSPVTKAAGRITSAQRQLRSFAMAGSAVGPASHAELGQEESANGKQLQGKTSPASLSVSSASSSSGKLATPIMINGRKLIPISLPAGLARKNRIDPALLQANVIPSVATVASAERQRSTSTHSSANSSSNNCHHRQAIQQVAANGVKCLLSNQPRTGTSSSRPPTASETIKLEYLARNASEQSSPATTAAAAPQLRHQKSFGGAILTPLSFADEERQARRRRSKTNEDGQLRPFTADAWGEAQYPSREQQAKAFSQQHRPPTGGDTMQQEGVKPLPAPPRPSSRPRTAQSVANNVAADQTRYRLPLRAVQGAQS